MQEVQRNCEQCYMILHYHPELGSCRMAEEHEAHMRSHEWIAGKTTEELIKEFYW